MAISLRLSSYIFCFSDELVCVVLKCIRLDFRFSLMRSGFRFHVCDTIPKVAELGTSNGDYII